jgi:hypothetical protein
MNQLNHNFHKILYELRFKTNYQLTSGSSVHLGEGQDHFSDEFALGHRQFQKGFE